MSWFWLTFLFSCLFTSGNSNQSSQDNEMGPMKNRCPGNCYAIADGSAQGYYCSVCADAHCAQCKTANECLLCFNGFYESGGACIENYISTCPIHCTACDDDGKCVRCDPFFFLDEDSCGASCPQRKFPRNPPASEPCEISKCADCPANCLQCSDANTCTQCDHGFDLFSNTCVVSCPSGSYRVDVQNCNACPAECATCLTSITCTSCISSYYLSVQNCFHCPAECTSCLSPTVCTACANSYYLDTQNCLACPVGCSACSSPTTCSACDPSYTFDPQSSTCNLPQNPPIPTTTPTAVAAVAAKSKTVTSAVTQVTSLLSSGKSIAMSASICGKILTNIRYLNITYSSKLQGVFDTWTTSVISFGFDFDMPENLDSKLPARHVPFVFKRYKIPSSFLENFWNNIFVLSGVLLIFVLLRIIEYIYKKSIQTQRNSFKAIIKTCRIYIQNFFVTLLCGIYGDAVLFSLIEYQSIKLEWNLALLSFATSIFFLLLAALSFAFHFRLLLKYQSLKVKKSQGENLEKFIQDTKGTQVLYKDYHDKNIWTQSFLPFLILRDLGFSLILASLFHRPRLQILLILLLNALMLLYLILCRPFKDRLDLIQQVFFEVAGLTVNISVLVNSQLSEIYEEMLSERERIGDGIILTNVIFNFVTAGFMALKLIMLLKDLYFAYKLKNAKNHPQRKKQALEGGQSDSAIISSTSVNTSISRLNNISFASQEDSLPIQEISSSYQFPLHRNFQQNHSEIELTSNSQICYNSKSRSPVRSPNRSFGRSVLEIPQENRREFARNSPSPFRIPIKEERPKKIGRTQLKRNRISALQKKQKMNGRINIDQRKNFD